MADVMSQHGLCAPTSRQDIISALLNDYATSFGRGDASTTVYSPVQELNSLPQTPRSNDIARKQLPPGVQAMHAKFPLRGKQILSSFDTIQVRPGRSNFHMFAFTDRPRLPCTHIGHNLASRDALCSCAILNMALLDLLP